MEVTPAKPLLLLAVVAATIAGVTLQLCPYNDPRHSICRFKPRACPGKVLIRSGGVTKAQQLHILDLHNQLRAWVAGGFQRGLPAASNMRALTWDDELAVIAQRWADQCTDGHDKERSVRRFHVGQNVALTWTYEYEDNLLDEPDWDSQIYAWYDECTQFNFKASAISPFQFSKKLGHFTQLVWADTYKVGCGYAYYRQSGRGLTKIYVCNYGPGGNIIGGDMYEKSPYATCKLGLVQSATSYRGLCDKDPFYIPPLSEDEDEEDDFDSSSSDLAQVNHLPTNYFLLGHPINITTFY
ncbi:venom allergen 3 [Ixodes scapularis]|uniref:venom allergen 3 n=1 Tax=Ixodes scapularis TaxID=6945 RepID=UPI001A9DBFDB|nr:venom allergen 3 [Ixodes scapularis]